MDIEKVGKICRENNLIFIVDASQSAGSIPIDIEKQNIDVLCFTGHKSLYGAQGTGGLYVREGILIDPLKVGGSGIDTYNIEHPAEMPERLEAGTLNSQTQPFVVERVVCVGEAEIFVLVVVITLCTSKAKT